MHFVLGRSVIPVLETRFPVNFTVPGLVLQEVATPNSLWSISPLKLRTTGGSSNHPLVPVRPNSGKPESYIVLDGLRPGVETAS